VLADIPNYGSDKDKNTAQYPAAKKYYTQANYKKILYIARMFTTKYFKTTSKTSAIKIITNNFTNKILDKMALR